jgi:hypothetical protein
MIGVVALIQFEPRDPLSVQRAATASAMLGFSEVWKLAAIERFIHFMTS